MEPKKVSLELGGKSPTIIFPDADIDAAIAGAASAIFLIMGNAVVQDQDFSTRRFLIKLLKEYQELGKY